MQTQTSPGGSTFPYYYIGGEIHCLKYGGFGSNVEALLTIMRAEEGFIMKPNRQLTVWVDFYETRITRRVLIAFIENIQQLRNHLLKLAIAGFSGWNQWRFRRLARKMGIDFSMPIKFFDDPEDAKTWLVKG